MSRKLHLSIRSFCTMSYLCKSMKSSVGFMRAIESAITNTKPLMRNGTSERSSTSRYRLRSHRHLTPARCLRLRQRIDSSTRFPSARTHSMHACTTTRTAYPHERGQSPKFRRMAWRQPQGVQCQLPSGLLLTHKATRQTAPAEPKFYILAYYFCESFSLASPAILVTACQDSF